MNHLNFGIATIADLPHIVEMKISMFDEAGHMELLSNNARAIMLKDYLRLYEKNKSLHFIARDKGEIVASAGAFLKYDLPFRYFKESEYGFLGDVYTAPAYRRLGVATRLSTDALNWLKSKKVTMVRLLASEAARPIYQKMGFASTDEMAIQWKT